MALQSQIQPSDPGLVTLRSYRNLGKFGRIRSNISRTAVTTQRPPWPCPALF